MYSLLFISIISGSLFALGSQEILKHKQFTCEISFISISKSDLDISNCNDIKILDSLFRANYENVSRSEYWRGDSCYIIHDLNAGTIYYSSEKSDNSVFINYHDSIVTYNDYPMIDPIDKIMPTSIEELDSCTMNHLFFSDGKCNYILSIETNDIYRMWQEGDVQFIERIKFYKKLLPGFQIPRLIRANDWMGLFSSKNHDNLKGIAKLRRYIKSNRTYKRIIYDETNPSIITDILTNPNKLIRHIDSQTFLGDELNVLVREDNYIEHNFQLGSVSMDDSTSNLKYTEFDSSYLYCTPLFDMMDDHVSSLFNLNSNFEYLESSYHYDKHIDGWDLYTNKSNHGMIYISLQSNDVIYVNGINEHSRNYRCVVLRNLRPIFDFDLNIDKNTILHESDVTKGQCEN